MQNIFIIELFGWISNILFAVCGFPEVYRCYKNRIKPGMTDIYLFVWWIAEVFALLYIGLKDYYTNILHIPIYLGLLAGFTVVSMLIYAKYNFEKK